VRLSDLMSAMQMSQYAELALVLFMAAFAAVALQLLGKGREREWDSARLLPLEDETDSPDDTRDQ